VPVVRERELQICGIDDRAGALATEQAAFEEVLLPLRRASLTSSDTPFARSNSTNPSSTSIVVSKDERTEPFSASQFQSSPRSCRVCSVCIVAVQGCPGSSPV